MAYYEHLPIYRKAMETAVYFENIVRNFSRYNKYNLGAEMRTKSRDIVKLIIKANSSREKHPVLYELREQLEELKMLIRISKEVKAFKNFKSFQHALECRVITALLFYFCGLCYLLYISGVDSTENNVICV